MEYPVEECQRRDSLGEPSPIATRRTVCHRSAMGFQPPLLRGFGDPCPLYMTPVNYSSPDFMGTKASEHE